MRPDPPPARVPPWELHQPADGVDDDRERLVVPFLQVGQLYFESSRREEVAAYLDRDDVRPFTPTLEETTRLIDGFESPLGMEALATVDWLLHEQGRAARVDEIRVGIRHWPGLSDAAERKSRILDEQLVRIALERLHELDASA